MQLILLQFLNLICRPKIKTTTTIPFHKSKTKLKTGTDKGRRDLACIKKIED